MLSQIIWENELTTGAAYNNEMIYDLEARVEAEMAQKGMQFLDGADLDQYRQRAKKWFDDNKGLSPGFYEKLIVEIEKVRNS